MLAVFITIMRLKGCVLMTLFGYYVKKSSSSVKGLFRMPCRTPLFSTSLRPIKKRIRS
nr:MAG TPA_asm: hypothetical protein [Bacteriophage sp.]